MTGDRTTAGTLTETLRAGLAEHLAAMPVSQAAVAREIDVSPKHLSHMLTGRAVLTLPWAERIAAVTGASISVTVTPCAAAPAEEIPSARCQRWRVHRPHHWSTGGPLKACPGVADDPEEGR